MLNKTPLANEKSNIYEIDQINSNLLQQIIQSRFISEGVYSIEQFSVGDYRELYVVTKSVLYVVEQ
jgi:S-DNA-T family DNA segregation ATPase FtsK/SpoIIIE